MKHGHKNTRAEPKPDLQVLQERINKWKLPSGHLNWHTRGQAVTEAHQFYNESFQLLKRDPYNAELSALNSRAHELWYAAIDAAYPPTFGDDWQQVRDGNAAGMEGMVQFLEADPVFYRTGYIKAKLTRYIKPDIITPSHAKRLQAVCLSLVDRRDDRDFRAFCHLARKVDSPALRDELAHRLTHPDPNIRRRARWMLDALGPTRPQKPSQP